MAIKINKGLAPYWFTPEDQKEEQEPARFKLKPLNQSTVVDVLQDAVPDDEGNPIISGKSTMKALQASITDWENIHDADGKPLKCAYPNFKHLPFAIQREIATELLVDAIVGKEETKNS